MTEVNIARAWKDPEYRSTLTESQLSQVPDNPAGAVDLNDEELSSVHGGFVDGLGSYGLYDGGQSFSNTFDTFVDNVDIPTINDGSICFGEGFTGPDPYPK